MVFSSLANLLGHSPFKAMQEHMRVAVQCADEVPALFRALCDGNQAEVEKVQVRIFELEEQADKIKNELRAHLPKSLFMPVDRRDLLDILNMQDSIADTAQDIAGILVERPMTVPKEMQPKLLELVDTCIEACHQSHKVIEELDELLEMGFGGRERTTVLEMVDELNLIEDKTDELGMELARLLFAHEDEMKPVSVMFWYQIIEWIGDLADYSEKVGDRLRLLIAR
jgi:predicted phosphate transport protein (TIGR00153 family)